MDEIEKNLPSLKSSLHRIKEAMNSDSERKVLGKEYEKMTSVSIDYGVMEKAASRSVLPASFRWSDVGDWRSLGALLGEDEKGNSSRGNVELEETEGSVVFNDTDKKIVAFGVKDLVIAGSEEAFLVMDKSDAEDLKDVL